MPRSTFGVSSLQGATPGLSKLAASLAGDGGYEGGFDKGLTLQSKLAQAVAQIRANNAAADAHQATADQTQAETGVLTGRGDAIDNAVAMQTGSTLPMVRAVQDFTRTGVMPMKPAMGPAEEDGTQASQFPAVDPGSQSKIAQALSRMLPLRTNLKDTKPDDLANAGKIYREGDLGDAIIRGDLNRNTVAGSQMAVAGKPIYHALENGTVLDQGTGVLNEGGGLAKANVGLVGQKQKSEQALAAERYAAAGQHSASAQKTRQEIEQGVKTGQLKLEKDADGNIVVVDMVKRTVEAAKDPATGLPVKTAPKGGAGKMTEDQGKATGWLVQATNAFDNMKGAVERSPGAATPGPGDAIAAVPFLGGLGNLVTGADRQRFNQGASSLSEALLRAATGAGVNKDEALQKVRELTPQFGDSASVRQQKMDAIPLYIESLKVRAGPGAAQAEAIPGRLPPKEGAPAAPKSEAEYNALPSGTTYVGPDGKTRRKL